MVRVPVEVVKQRCQARPDVSARRVLSSTLGQEGAAGLYRGFLTTVLREVPFSILQVTRLLVGRWVLIECWEWAVELCRTGAQWKCFPDQASCTKGSNWNVQKRRFECKYSYWIN